MLFVGLIFSIVYEYIRPGSFIPIILATKIGTVVPLLVFVLAVFKLRPVSNGKMIEHPNSRWLFFFILLLGLSVIVSDVTLYSYSVFKDVLEYLFWYVMIVKIVVDLDKTKAFMSVLVWSHVALVALNPALVLQPEQRSYLRGAPFLGDGNDFALSACIAVPMAWFLLSISKTKVAKVFYLIAITVLIGAIIGTQSRGGSLALVSVILFLWLHSRRKAVGAALIAIVAVASVSFAPDVYFERMSSIANYQTEGSAMGRINAWKTAIRMARAYPVTGVGTGHFAVKAGTEFRPPSTGNRELPWLNAHSVYFLILGELGLPGITFLLAILFGNFIRLNRLLNRSRGSPEADMIVQSKLFLSLSASLVAFCVGGTFLGVAYYPHLFVLSGLIVAATNVYESGSVAESVTVENYF